LILLLWCYDIQQNTAFCNVLTRYSSSILLSHFMYCFAVFLFLSIIVQKSNFEMKIKVALHKRLFFSNTKGKSFIFSTFVVRLYYFLRLSYIGVFPPIMKRSRRYAITSTCRFANNFKDLISSK
jgi:hypothetical protein